MTWGTHCSMCGREDCSWADGERCEGREKASDAISQPSVQQTAREAFEDEMDKLGWKTDHHVSHYGQQITYTHHRVQEMWLLWQAARAALSQPSVGIDELSAIIFSRTQAPMDRVYSAAEAFLAKYNVTVKG